MKEYTLTLPMMGLIASTRAFIGAGLALLLADKLGREERRAVGWSLLAVGAITTIPLVAQFSQSKASEFEKKPEKSAPLPKTEPVPSI